MKSEPVLGAEKVDYGNQGQTAAAPQNNLLEKYKSEIQKI
jgi:hypothetical protein